MARFGRWLKKALASRLSKPVDYVENVSITIVDMKNPIHIDISQSEIGFLNTGSIRDVGSIDVFIGALKDEGRDDVAEGLKALTEAVVKSREIVGETDKQELLDQIDLLAQQAAIGKSDRRMGVVKATFGALAATAGAAGGLASVWSTWGPVIARFFGI